MFQKELIKRLLPHVSSLSLAFGFLIFYLIGNPEWLDQYLPTNGKPLVIFLLLGLILVYELSINGQKLIEKKVVCVGSEVKKMSKQMQINKLIHSVNNIYSRFLDSGDDWISHEYTIKELSELKDMRDDLGVNSYTQGKLEFLMSKVKHDINK